MTPKPRIAIFFLGGTIAMVPRGRGLEVGVDAAELTAAIVARDPSIEVERQSFRSVASANLTFDDVVELAKAIGDAFDDGAAGAVVVQGTDTIEEVAFLLDLLLDGERPVVVTGALRSPSEAGADGPANLLAAVRASASGVSSGLGVLVAMNDELHAARFVTKSHTHKVSGFASRSAGPLGWVVEGRTHLALRPARRSPTLSWGGRKPFVPLLQFCFDDDCAASILWLEASGAEGLVVAGLGAGHVPSAAVPALAKAAARIPVVLCSRTGAGAVMSQTYSYPGSEIDLLSNGLIHGSFLDPPKARILLSLLIAAGADKPRIASTFAHFTAGPSLQAEQANEGEAY